MKNNTSVDRKPIPKAKRLEFAKQAREYNEFKIA